MHPVTAREEVLIGSLVWIPVGERIFVERNGKEHRRTGFTITRQQRGDVIHELRPTLCGKLAPRILPRPDMLCVKLSVAPPRRQSGEDHLHIPCKEMSVLFVNGQAADHEVLASVQPRFVGVEKVHESLHQVRRRQTTGKAPGPREKRRQKHSPPA